MSTVIRISDELALEAKTRSNVEKRSMTSQVEYWARISKIAEDNPNLPFSFIREILLAQEEAKSKKVFNSPLFGRNVKKLNKKEKEILDEEIKKIVANPGIGEEKKGDL